MAFLEVTPLPLLIMPPVAPERGVSFHEVGSAASVLGLWIALRAYSLYARDRGNGHAADAEQDALRMAGG